MEEKKFYIRESLYIRIPRAFDHLKKELGVRVDFKQNVTQIRCYADKNQNGLLRPVNKNIELDVYRNMGGLPYIGLAITVRPHVCVRIYSDKTRRYPYHVETTVGDANTDMEYIEYYNLPHCRTLKVSGGDYVEIRDSVFRKQTDGIYYRPFIVFPGRQLPLEDDKNIILAEAESKSVKNHLDVIIKMNELAKDYKVIPLPTRREIKVICKYKPSILKTAEENENYSEVVKTAKEIITANKIEMKNRCEA